MRNPLRTGLCVLLAAWSLWGATAAADASAVDKPPAQEYRVFGSLANQDAPAELALAPNEPVYFVVGGGSGSDDVTARFQFSFLYRIFDDEGVVAERWPLLTDLNFAYTQTTIWNLSESSRPFEDTSYRPSLFWQWLTPRRGLLPDFLRAGYEHESNGRGADASRSIDTLFLHPGWAWPLGKRELVIAPKFYAYLDKVENADIAEYRGYADWIVRYGREDGWLASALLRYGTDGHGSVQLDLSYPIRRPIFTRAGGFFYLQLFQGYGQNLLGYDREEDLQVRAGVAIVR